MEDRNQERLKLHRAVNDLNPIRPVVLIDELPWNELNIDDQLTCVCRDPFLKSFEYMIRRRIFQYKHFPADMVLKPYLTVDKIIKSIGGLNIHEETLSVDNDNTIVAHQYVDQLKTQEDLEMLSPTIYSYDRETTLKNYQLLGDVVGDIMPIKIKGLDHFSVGTWDRISEYRGVTPLLMDIIERPEFTHEMVRKITDNYKSQLCQDEELGVFDNDPSSLHCTPIANSKLAPGSQEKVTRENIWGRGVAQIFASVSKQMRDEFDIEYMKETVGTCGLVYYGCCEPLHKMIDIVEKIPNIRKIGITPWADPKVAAEAMGNKYVFSSKPNPASVSVSNLDIDGLKKELSGILKPCRENDCVVDITLKDISTAGYNLDNIINWEKTAMEMAKDY